MTRMSNDKDPSVLSWIVGVICGFLLGGCAVVSFERHQAIAHNAAHYEVNPTTGETKFVWNNNNKEEERK